MPEPKIEFRDWTPLAEKTGPHRTKDILVDGDRIGFSVCKVFGSVDVTFEPVKPISREIRTAVMDEVGRHYPNRKLTLQVANRPKSDQ